MFGSSSTSTGGFGGFYTYSKPVPTGHVEIRFQPPVRPDDVMSLSQRAAQALWPEGQGTGLRALTPLIASVAREVNARRQGCHIRIVRNGPRQHLEPVLPPPPADGEWPAEDAVVVATERDQIASA